MSKKESVFKLRFLSAISLYKLYRLGNDEVEGINRQRRKLAIWPMICLLVSLRDSGDFTNLVVYRTIVHVVVVLS